MKEANKFMSESQQIRYCIKLLRELGMSHKEAVEWIWHPLDLLFGMRPVTVIAKGEGKPLIKWLEDRAGINYNKDSKE